MYATVEFSMLRCQKPGLKKINKTNLIKCSANLNRAPSRLKSLLSQNFKLQKSPAKFKTIILTNTEWKGAVPSPPFAPQAGEHLRTFQGIAWVTAVRHDAPCKMTLVLPLVAKLGNTWILAFHELETFSREREVKKRQIRTEKKERIVVLLMRQRQQRENWTKQAQTTLKRL